MKHIKLFEQFINEAYSSDKVSDAIVKLFIKAGFNDPVIGSRSVSVKLPNDTKKAPAEIVKLEKEIYTEVEKAKQDINKYSKFFEENYIIQSIIHINMNDKRNLTGTVSKSLFNAFKVTRLFDGLG